MSFKAVLEAIQKKYSIEGFYVVKKGTNDQPGSGPYKTKKEAEHKVKFLQWYDPKKWDIRYGTTLLNDKFSEVREKE